jgi:hypothetical protein
MKKNSVILLDGTECEFKSNWEAVDALTDEDIIAAVLADPDTYLPTPEELKDFRRASDIPGDTIHEKCKFPSG